MNQQQTEHRFDEQRKTAVRFLMTLSMDRSVLAQCCAALGCIYIRRVSERGSQRVAGSMEKKKVNILV